VAGDECTASGWPHDGGQDADHRRLPRSVRAEETEDLALCDGERDTLKGLDAAAVRLAYVLDFDR
jgi:hypothetical protein